MLLSDKIDANNKHLPRVICLGLLITLMQACVVAADSPAPTKIIPGVQKTQPAQSQPAGLPPKFRCDEMEYNFGTAWASGKVEHTWIIHNDGKGVLTIEAKPTCGCTVASFDKTIEPGKTGKVSAVLSTGNYTGDSHKSIIIITNDKTLTNGQVSLALKGKIKQKVTSEPPLAAYFGQMAPGTNLTKTFKLTNNTDKPMKVKVTPPTDPHAFKVEVKEIEPGKVAELIVTVVEPLKDGANHGVFTVSAGLEGVPDMSFPCNITKPPVVEISPTVIRLPSMPLVNTYRQVVNYRNNSKTGPIKLISATCNDERITTKVTENAPGVLYTITLTVPKDYILDPRKGTVLTITTDRAAKPVETIPFIGAHTRPHPTSTRPAAITPDSLIGGPAPSASTTTLDGRQIRFGSGTDKITVINFWSSWCTPSRTQLDRLEQVYRKYQRKDVQFVNVSVDQFRPKNELVEVVQALKSTIPMAQDLDLAIAKKYGVTQFPALFLVGRNGAVESVRLGIGRMPAELDDLFDNLEFQIDKLLEGKTREQFPIRPPIVGANCAIENAFPSANLLDSGGLYIESLRQDVGLFKPKSQGSYKLYIRNNGLLPIQIKDITASGSMKVAPDYVKVIEAGATRFVNCTFEAPATGRSFAGRVTIETNDVRRPKLSAFLTGQTIPLVVTEPKTGIDFSYKPKTFVVPRMVTLTYNGPDKIVYDKPESNNPKFEAEIQVRQPDLALLTIKALPPFPPGMAKALISVKTNQTEQPTVIVPVRLYMPKRIEVLPPTVEVKYLPKSQPISASLMNTGDKPLKILGVHPSRPEIQVEYTLEPDKLSYNLQISLPNNFVPSPTGDRITIVTDDKEFGELVLPIVRENH